MKIVVFEQDCLHAPGEGTLNNQYVGDWLDGGGGACSFDCDANGYTTVGVPVIDGLGHTHTEQYLLTIEMNDDDIIIISALNEEGESFKFIGVK